MSRNGPLVACRQSPGDHAGMAAQLEPEWHGQHGEAEPGSQMRADAPDAAGVVEFDNHRVGDTDSRDPSLAHCDTGLPLADELAPVQSAQAAERGAHEYAQVGVPAEDHPAEERRDELRV